MAKVKVKNLRNVSSNIRTFLIKQYRSKEARDLVGEAIVDAIQDKNFGTPKSSTLKWRERYDQLNKTHPKYKRAKINITFTGELLEDLKNNVKVGTTRGIEYVIEQSNKLHKKYNGVKKKIGKRTPYKDIQKGIEDHGYDYLSVTKDALKEIRDRLKEFIIKKYKDINK